MYTYGRDGAMAKRFSEPERLNPRKTDWKKMYVTVVQYQKAPKHFL
jgi:hypothetical protein